MSKSVFPRCSNGFSEEKQRRLINFETIKIRSIEKNWKPIIFLVCSIRMKLFTWLRYKNSKTNNSETILSEWHTRRNCQKTRTPSEWKNIDSSLNKKIVFVKLQSKDYVGIFSDKFFTEFLPHQSLKKFRFHENVFFIFAQKLTLNCSSDALSPIFRIRFSCSELISLKQNLNE